MANRDAGDLRGEALVITNNFASVKIPMLYKNNKKK